MTTKQNIQNWKWRIVKAGHNAKTFSELCDISQPLLSQYMSGKTTPSLGNYDKVESALKDLGV